MKKNLIFSVLAVLLAAIFATPVWSQNTAQVEGKVLNAGKPVPNAQITMTNGDNNRKYKVKADKNGAFMLIGVEFGRRYHIEVTGSNGEQLYAYDRPIMPPEGGGPTQVTIDVSQAAEGQGGQASQPKYTKEQVDEMQKQKEKAENTNVLIKQAIDDMNAKNWSAALPILQQLVASDPNNWQYQQALGNTKLSLEQYEQAADAYAKGIQSAEAITNVDPKNPLTDPVKKKAGLAQMYTNEGNALLKLKKNNEAVAAFTKAASLDPNPATAYFNLCATQYNTGNVDGALDACDKAIAADPTKADAYFIKGSLLVGESKMENGKMVPPPGAAEALNKYLELQPQGPHAADVKQMLDAIGSKVETTYKKGKGK
jgi:tetratricopeptide (TPR) repeat protein